jgi:drug/metabolite transporter (DMT)-like permease
MATAPGTTAPPFARRRSRGEAFVLLALGNTLWAGTYAAGKIALGSLSFVQLNALRFSIATLIMIPVLWSARSTVKRELSRSRSFRELARLVLLGFVLNKAFEYAGLSLATAVDVALLIATESIFTAALSWVLLDEPVTASGVAALIVGLAGAYLIVARALVPKLAGPGGVARIVGDLLVVLALIFEAHYTIGGKTSLERVPPLLLTSISVAGSLVVWIPAAAVMTAISGLPAMTTNAWLALVYMAVFGTVVGYWMWFGALSVLNASHAAPFLFIQPLLGAALGVVLLGETLTWATIAGAGLILVSLAIVTAGAQSPRGAVLLVAEPPQ